MWTCRGRLARAWRGHLALPIGEASRSGRPRHARAGCPRHEENAMSWFYGLHPVWQALIATIGTWLVTAAGAALVVFTRKVSQKYLDASLAWPPG